MKLIKMPRNIFQTWETKHILSEFKKLTESWTNINQKYAYYLFDNDDREKFIKKHFDISVYNSYCRIIPGAFKADLWRYCILYIYGGVYVDIDTICIGNIDLFLNEDVEFMTVIDLNNNPSIGTHNLSNGFIASIPKHQILLDCINRIVYNVENNIVPASNLDFTGPGILGRATNIFLNIKEDTSFIGKQGLHKNNTIYLLTFENNTEYIKNENNDILFQNKNGNPYIQKIYNEEIKTINYINWGTCKQPIKPLDYLLKNTEKLSEQIRFTNSLENTNSPFDNIDLILENSQKYIDLNNTHLAYIKLISCIEYFNSNKKHKLTYDFIRQHIIVDYYNNNKNLLPEIINLINEKLLENDNNIIKDLIKKNNNNLNFYENKNAIYIYKKNELQFDKNEFDITKYIDKIIYINLEHRTDRKKEIENELDNFRLPYERFNAIATPNFGILGCSLSHLAVLKMARDNKWKNILIFEDDFIFSVDKKEFYENIKLLFDKENPVNFDICMLSYNLIKSEPSLLYPFLQKVLEVQTTSGYIVNEKIYDRLIELYEWSIPLLESTKQSCVYALDIVWKKLQPSSNWYAFNNRIGIQRPSYSDIEKSFCNYNC